MSGSNSAPVQRRGGRLVARWGSWLLLLTLAVVLLHWTWPPLRAFPPSKAFAGAQWYDPYAPAGPERLRANFHVHSHAWGGLTAGEQSSEQVRSVYRSLGYDVFAISNYQLIDVPGPGDGIPITSYEHGFGPSAHHQSVIGADRVRWSEFLLPQGARHKQFILDALRPDAPIVVLNHPNREDSYSFADLEQLVGYTGIEIRSRHSESVPYWDVALSAGRPVWGFCSDDRHRVRYAKDVGYGWLVVHAADRAPESVLEALRVGAFHSIWTYRRPDANSLVFAGLIDSRLRVEVARPADEIRFIGQGGRLLRVVPGSAAAEYALAPDDTYVRVEVAMERWTLYLNPVFRYDGDPLSHPQAPALAAQTAFARIGALLVVGIGFGILRRWRSG